PVNNHGYCKMAALVVVGGAGRGGRRLSCERAAGWDGLAALSFLAVVEAANVIINHEGYVYREGDVASATPETLVGMFPFTYDPGPIRESATLRFYLDRVSAYVGYPMLSAPLAAWAARPGDRALS